MTLPKNRISDNFSKAAVTYDAHSHLQLRVGSKLLGVLPADFIPQRILDAGCGTGKLTELMADKFQSSQTRIDAFDIAPGMIEVAEKKKSAHNINYFTADLDEYKNDGKYDLVFANGTLQWVERLDRVLGRLYKMTAEDGVLLFSIFLDGTFRELREIIREHGKEYDISHSLKHFDELGAVMRKTPWDKGFIKEYNEQVYYDDFRDFSRQQKHLGTGNVLPEKGLPPRKFIAAIDELEKRHKDERGLPMNYNFALVLCRKKS